MGSEHIGFCFQMDSFWVEYMMLEIAIGYVAKLPSLLIWQSNGVAFCGSKILL